MGTAETTVSDHHDKSGVIPRIIHDIFSRISDAADTSFYIKATYLEIIKEEVGWDDCIDWMAG